MNGFRHCYRVRAGYADTDQSGIVHHGVYVRWLEEARVEWLRAQNFSLAKLEEQSRIGFAVHKAELYYRLPARFEDLIEIDVWVGSLGRAKLRFDYELRCKEQTLGSATITLACIDLDRMRARGLPPEIREACQP